MRRAETHAERIWIAFAWLIAAAMFVAGLAVVLQSFAPERMPL